jgi:hypothetical protein
MANKRTVDPDAAEASIRIIGMRVTSKQMEQIRELCERRNVKRSRLFRDLLREAWYRECREPEPF